jgi:DegV family protein with EDD domain
MRIKISADSTCDLPKALLNEYNIGITPLYIIKNGTSYRDGVDISPREILEHLEKTGENCGTAAVTVQDYIDHWTRWKQGCDAIVHIGFSGKMSATLSNALLAAGEVGDVYVVDGQNPSAGHGLLVLEAAQMAGAGRSPQEIVAAIEALAPLVDASFIIDTLFCLAKGGRCSALTAFGANALGLKPCIEVSNGTMGVGKKYRGKVEKVYPQYIRDRLEGNDRVDTRRIFIADSGIDEAGRQAIKRQLLALHPFEEVYVTSAGCTITSHCGPKTMGIFYLKKPEGVR